MLDLSHVVFRRNDFTLSADCRFTERITGIFGHSGAGKTTMLHLIAGLLRPSGGKIVLNGRVLADAEKGLFVPPHLRRVGVVFQEPRLFPHLSAHANILYGSRSTGANFDEIVSLLKIDYLLGEKPSCLSGGERQRVSLARALLSLPEILLMDEPMSFLDFQLVSDIIPLLETFSRRFDIPVIFISHHLNQILQLTRRIVLLEKGCVAASGDLPDLIFSGGVLDLLPGLELSNVLKLSVLECNSHAGQAVLGKPGRSVPVLFSHLDRLVKGQSVTIEVRPEDIALGTATVESLSIRNQLKCCITRVTGSRTYSFVEIDAGFAGLTLIAKVSLPAREKLGLSPGRECVCFIKQSEIRILGTGEPEPPEKHQGCEGSENA
ncbi:MAG: molybdenum ABC transporter ATP-binding protein [Candidatus Wallbacteria bacterium]|nr:molybdenum ABC transporter ATP-binding protein [Candidatus Wallbacteria bacterium]